MLIDSSSEAESSESVILNEGELSSVERDLELFGITIEELVVDVD